ncbi:MAG: hypothetical protein NTW08_06925 [Gammaproteobacteria bacterium]|nr:hypothetical protein [Gammaproteobacteria bacterium]
MKHWLCGLGWLVCFGQAFSFPCYVTVLKDSCWTNYDVQVMVMDGVQKKQLLAVSVPKGQAYQRQKFECSARQELAFNATFQPVIWENEKGMVYPAKQFVFLPEAVNKDDKAWNIPICFSSAFTKVPMPPAATGQCVCDFATVPALTPKDVELGK